MYPSRFSCIALSLSIGLFLTACGQKEGANNTAQTANSSPATSAPAAQASTSATENVLGKSVYGKTCSMCHAANVAGAPKPGDKADWAPRIAQGMDLLYQHALQGFTGSKGQMPARGGAATLSDEEVKAGVNYMVDLSR